MIDFADLRHLMRETVADMEARRQAELERAAVLAAVGPMPPALPALDVPARAVDHDQRRKLALERPDLIDTEEYRAREAHHYSHRHGSGSAF